MNFEETIKKIKAGTASPDERAFVISRISRADEALNGKSAIDFDKAVEHLRDGTATDVEREYVKAQLDEAMELMRSPVETNKRDGQSDQSEPKIEYFDENEAQKPATIEFDAALEHVQKGIASEQEKLYVMSQTAAANALFSDSSRATSAPVKEASGEDVKKAKKSFKKRYVLIPLCVLIAVIVALGAILGGVFGFAASSANKNIKFDQSQCKQLAIDYVFANQLDIPGVTVAFEKNDLWIDDCEKEFRYNSKNLGESSYYYKITVEGRKFDGLFKYELEVDLLINTKTGNIGVDKTEFDWDR